MAGYRVEVTRAAAPLRRWGEGTGGGDVTTNRSSSLEEIEAQVRKETAEKHREEIGLVDDLLRCCLRGVSRVGSFTLSAENELQHAQLLLGTRSFNSLRCAFKMLTQGYYSQALTLVRSASEDILTALDCEKNASTLKAVLGGNAERLGKGKLTYAEMAKRQGDKFYKAWRYNYGVLSEYAAHARKNSLKVLVDPETRTLRLGSHYDRELFIGACHALLAEAIKTADTIAKVLGPKAEPWQRETWPTLKAALGWTQRIGDKVESGQEA